ncbi:MAG: AraC family transcriptional regulator [Acidobacteria bacterium]|nr:MAG: AraC family transcriptional regulator [Acidobacteriota bacterium]
MSHRLQTEAPQPSIPLVNIAWIHPFLEILDEVGAPYDQLLEEAGLPSLAVDDASALVPTAAIYEFVHLATAATGIPDLGLRAGRRLEIETILPSGESLWSQPGVFRTLERFIDVCLESSSNVDMWVESRSDRAKTVEFFYQGTFGPENRAFPTVEQFMVALMVRLTRLAAGPRWNPDLVNFRAASVPKLATRRLVGNAEVRCGQTKTSILFPARQWVSRVESFPDPGSAVWKRHRKSLTRWNEAADLVGSLRLVLRAYLPDGSPDIGLAAGLTGSSVRTLQRRLAEGGTSYSQLLEELRHDLALYLLRDPDLQASEISRELGYRDPAIFTRAFRRWTGQTPSQYRRTLHT